MKDPIDDCVHCGFCLPACPTYVSWAQEMDSPRGRIYLMKGLRDGTLSWDRTVATHFDRCLGCMACVTACPSGVQYDVLIESTRAAREKAVHRDQKDALFRGLLFAFFPYPGRLRIAGIGLWALTAIGLRWLVRKWAWTPPRLAQLDALAPDVALRDLFRVLPAQTRAAGERRARVGLVAGCVQRVFFPAVNAATLRVLSAEGCETVVPAGQGCCGALSLHAGRSTEAKAFARALIQKFENANVEFVVVNSAGCGSSLKEYGRLFDHDPEWRERAHAFSSKVRDVCEFLAALPQRAVRHPIGVRAAYHDACHLRHAQGVRHQPRKLLAAVPGLTLREVPRGDQCCGSAGIYNLLEPRAANEIGERKVENILSTSPDLIISANPGCTLQLRSLLRARSVSVPALHPIEVLDRSLRGESVR